MVLTEFAEQIVPYVVGLDISEACVHIYVNYELKCASMSNKANRTDTTASTADPTRRERQVLDILYTQGPASVGQMQNRLPDSPSYSATRMLLQR